MHSVLVTKKSTFLLGWCVLLAALRHLQTEQLQEEAALDSRNTAWGGMGRRGPCVTAGPVLHRLGEDQSRGEGFSVCLLRAGAVDLHSFIHSANVVEHLLEARNWGGIAHRVLRCDLTLNKNSKDLYNSAHITYQEFLSAFGTSHSHLQYKCLTRGTVNILVLWDKREAQRGDVTSQSHTSSQWQSWASDPGRMAACALDPLKSHF